MSSRYLYYFLLNRKKLIDSKIENAVSKMQVVIELGRILRDRRTLPIKVHLQFVLNRYFSICIDWKKLNFNISTLCRKWLLSSAIKIPLMNLDPWSAIF